MDELLAVSLSYPTLVYSVLLVVAIGYWLLAMIGAVGVDTLDLDADLDVDADVDADIDLDAGAVVGFWAGLSLRKIPVTIALTLLFFVGWLICNLTSHYLGGLLTALVPVSVWGTAVLLGATVLAVLLASFVSIPLVPLFDTHEAASRSDLVGKVIEVRTGRVDRQFGQGVAEDGGAGLLVEIRCEPDRLKRGDKALVISHDDLREFYEVEPMDDIMAKETR